MGERLPVNVFENVLPLAYTFIDPMDDASKWDQYLATPDFNTFTEGDIWGYYGKGIRMDVGMAAANTMYRRKRSIVASHNGNYIISYSMRCSSEFLNGAEATSPIFNVNILLPGSNSGLTGIGVKEFEVQCFGHFTLGNTPGILTFNVKSGTSTVFAANRFVYYSSTGLVLPSPTTYEPPWLRITSVILNNRLVDFRINNTSYTPVLGIQEFNTINDVTSKVTMSIQKRRNGIVENPWVDVDQIMITETENI